MSAYACGVKIDWSANPDLVRELADTVAESARQVIAKERCLRTLDKDQEKILLKDSICPLPLHKTLILLEEIQKHTRKSGCKYARLALAKALVSEISNLHFGPEVGVRGRKEDAPVIESWHLRLYQMAEDLERVQGLQHVSSIVWRHDSRGTPQMPDASVSAVITSPPYPNEKDYTRTTRLESTILGFISSRKDLRTMKETLLRSNSRNIYKGDTDDIFVENNAEVHHIANTIERRRIELGKTSGFEKQYANVVRMYFGGMARHFAELRRILKPGAKLAYVVGDQASFLLVMIRTGQILAQIAESLGYKVENIDLFRTRIATATREQLREEVLVLRWPGW
jgi:hypothetical protein